MDFSFLNTLLRSTELPPPEPWLAGTTLSYTYFGHFLAAAAGKLLGIHPGLLFNLAIAMTAALAASAILAAGAALGGRLRTGAVAVFLALFLAAPSGPCTAFDFHFRQAGRALDWHYFWATSRVIAPNGINEYPFWSFLFADLHAHVLALPFTAAFVAVLLLFVTRDRGGALAFAPRQAAALVALAGLFFAALQITNGWSTPVYACLLLFLPGVLWLGTRPAGFAASVRALARSVLLPAAGVVARGRAPRAPVLGALLAAAAELGPRGGPVGAAVGLLQRVGVLRRRSSCPSRSRRGRRALAAPREGRARVPDPRGDRPPPVPRVASRSIRRGSPRRPPRASSRPSRFSSPFGAVRRATDEPPAPGARPRRVRLRDPDGLRGRLRLGPHEHDLQVPLRDVAPLLPRGGARVGDVPGLEDRSFGAPRSSSPAPPPSSRPSPRSRASCATTAAAGRAARSTARPTSRSRAPPTAARSSGSTRTSAACPSCSRRRDPPYQDFTRLSMHTGLPTVLGWDYHVCQRGHSAGRDRAPQAGRRGWPTRRRTRRSSGGSSTGTTSRSSPSGISSAERTPAGISRASRRGRIS